MSVEIDAIQSAKSIGWTDALLSRLAANSVSLNASLTLAGGTRTTSVPLINGTQTWNAAGVTFTADVINVTDTASAAASLLIDRQVGGTSKFSVSKIGLVTIGNSLVFTGGIYNTTAKSGMGYNAVGEVAGTYFGLGSGGLGSLNVFLYPDAANTLALRNSTNAQAFNIYNTYTSGSVYERGFMRWVSNVLEIGTEHVGASARALAFKTDNTTRWSISTTGHLLAATDNSFDIGASGATRPRNVFVGGYVAAASGFGSSAGGSSQGFYFSGSNTLIATAAGASTIIQDSSGNVALNIVANAGPLIRFGGTTSSFPALKRSSTVLQSRLADDSDFAPLQGRLRSHANATSETPTATHTLRLFDAAGTEYRVLAIAV